MHIIHHYIVALVIRLTLIIYGIAQDNILNVKYTDIDYHVFTDSAKYVVKGESPFRRHTYRYTPILAYLLIPNILLQNAFGKIIFCSLDILTSILIYKIVKNYGYSSDICKNSSFLWLYNPLTMIISTRGNAESIMSTLVMLCIYFFQKNKPSLCGLVYGLSVHFKIYPCIYAISFYFAYSSVFTIKSNKLKTLFALNKNKLIFVICSVIGFALPTILFAFLYGEEYVWEALLYHITRKDIRHNFSPYFYVLYLSEAMDKRLSVCISAIAFFTQFSTVFITAWVFHLPKLLPISMFIQTFCFVTLNKVCTSQYFLWYICLFPLAYPSLDIKFKQLTTAFIAWMASQGLWLLPAYLLEFKGYNVFLWVWIASLIFYSVNMYLICLFVKHVKYKYDSKKFR